MADVYDDDAQDAAFRLRHQGSSTEQVTSLLGMSEETKHKLQRALHVAWSAVIIVCVMLTLTQSIKFVYELGVSEGVKREQRICSVAPVPGGLVVGEIFYCSEKGFGEQ